MAKESMVPRRGIEIAAVCLFLLGTGCATSHEGFTRYDHKWGPESTEFNGCVGDVRPPKQLLDLQYQVQGSSLVVEAYLVPASAIVSDQKKIRVGHYDSGNFDLWFEMELGSRWRLELSPLGSNQMRVAWQELDVASPPTGTHDIAATPTPPNADADLRLVPFDDYLGMNVAYADRLCRIDFERH